MTPKRQRPSLPLFDDVEGIKPQVEESLSKVHERPAIALVEVDRDGKKGSPEYGIYLLAQNKAGKEIIGGVRLKSRGKDPCEVACDQIELLGIIEDIKALFAKAGPKRPRLFRFHLTAKAS